MAKRVCFFVSNLSWTGGTIRCTSLIANMLALESQDFDIFIVDLISCKSYNVLNM